MMRELIISEIRRIASETGQAPGIKTFESLSGIRTRQWRGKFWVRWSDALVEAGFKPNQLNEKIDKKLLLSAFAEVALDMGRLPTEDEYRMRCRSNRKLPSYSAIRTHFGNRESLISALRAWATSNENEAQSAIFTILPEQCLENVEVPNSQRLDVVYLVRSGAYYKIGRSSNFESRVKALATSLPEKLVPEHIITTDDPIGIEAYWHHRFEDRRANGEWFKLSKADVLAFKKRKFQ